MWTELIWLRIWPMVGFNEHDNELYGSINDGKFLDYLRHSQLLKNPPAPWSYLLKHPYITISNTLLMDVITFYSFVVSDYLSG
jgi:hypothetical protein